MITVAIDGPSAAGKSSIAKALAKRLGIVYIDTGAMYRALALFSREKGVSWEDEKGVVALLDKLEIKLDYADGEQRLYLNGKDVSAQIRENDISSGASMVSSYKRVRQAMVRLQQSIAQDKSIVMDGRDIGAVVLPNATHKFFVTASAQARALRRYDELDKKNTLDGKTLKAILAQTAKRDYDDSHREHSPLKPTADALLVDTTDMSLEQAVEFIYNKVTGI